MEIDQERYSIGTTRKIESENTQAPTDVQHKLFELFLVNEVINHLCKQSKIYTNSKGNFTFHNTSDEFRTFLTILLLSGYMLVLDM